jgi:pimeloyl-ACP methyl ester carboxylesterase
MISPSPGNTPKLSGFSTASAAAPASGISGYRRVLRRDMRGHGQSADPGPNYVWSVDNLLNDMKGFLDTLGLDPVHYVGESLGGILGVAFAARWPERFKTITLCSTPPVIFPPIQKMFALGYENWETALGKLLRWMGQGVD